MEKIYEHAKDLHVVATMVYSNGTDDTKAYADAECTVQFKASELKEAFIKGALINVNGTLHKPVFFDGSINTIFYIGTNAPSGDVVLAGLAGASDEE